MAHRPLSWLLLGAALLSGCAEATETIAIRNDTATPLTATVELRGDFQAFDCAQEDSRSYRSVRGTAALTIAPGRRLCLRGPGDSQGVDALDALHRLSVARGEQVCVEGDQDSLRDRFDSDATSLPTLDVREADCQ